MNSEEEERERFFAERWERWKQEKRELNELLGDGPRPSVDEALRFLREERDGDGWSTGRVQDITD
jgi:hypothetical protein